MQTRKQYVILTLALLIFTSISTPLLSDIYLKQKQHMDAMTVMGQTRTAEEIITETWIT